MPVIQTERLVLRPLTTNDFSAFRQFAADAELTRYMLFYPQGYQKPARLQGAFVSDEEVSSIVEFLADKNPKVTYNPQIEQQVNSPVTTGMSGDERDIHFEEAGKFIIEKEKASIGMLQRMFKIGFNRAARIMDQLCDAGVVGPEEGTKPRKVLMSMEEFQNYLENQ